MTDCQPNRRETLGLMGAFTGWTCLPRIASAAGARDPRFLFVILRGAMDGLSTVVPLGDPEYERARGGLILPDTGPDAALPLDGFFGLNPNLETLHRIYRQRQALFFHAVATPYRERSHFDGQDVLENGHSTARERQSGWLNRALATLPSGGSVRTRGAMSVGSAIPLVMKGKERVSVWLPQGFPQASDDTRQRLLDLYTHTDPRLARIFERAIETDALVGGEAAMGEALRDSAANAKGIERRFRIAAASAGKLLAKPAGPRIAVLDFHGWDTHLAAGIVKGRLPRQLRALDAAIGQLEQELKPVWGDTVVLVATEFGRTVHVNGSAGTDHGTGTLAFAFGGAVRGGRVVADWPGLADRALFEGRDLAPTTDLRAVFKGFLGEHLGIGARALDGDVFPETRDVRALRDLVV